MRAESRAGLAFGAIGEGAGGLAREGAVQQAEGLGGDRGDGPARAARVGVGAVERLEERIAQVAPDEDVEAAAIPVLEPGRDGPDCPLARELVSSEGSGGKTPGPPSAGFNWPETASKASRIASPSSRRRFCRAEQVVLRVGLDALLGSTRDDWR